MLSQVHPLWARVDFKTFILGKDGVSYLGFHIFPFWRYLSSEKINLTKSQWSKNWKWLKEFEITSYCCSMVVVVAYLPRGSGFEFRKNCSFSQSSLIGKINVEKSRMVIYLISNKASFRIVWSWKRFHEQNTVQIVNQTFDFQKPHIKEEYLNQIVNC